MVQTLEQAAREILTVLQSVHQPSGFKESERLAPLVWTLMNSVVFIIDLLSSVPSKCAKARELFCTVRTQLGELKTKFPVEQYYR